MGKTIELKAADGHTFSAYVASPEKPKGHIVVIQEIFGVNHHMRNISDQFVKDGYAVVCPALFDRAERGQELGYKPEDMAKGRELRGKIPEAQSVLDIEAAAKYLNASKVGIVGYCFGGTVSWWGATKSKAFAAASGWYGGGIAAQKNDKPNCPVQLHFGEKDAAIPMTDVDAIKAAQPGVEVYVYEGAQHGFACDERPSFDAKAAALAHKRTLEFFAKHL